MTLWQKRARLAVAIFGLTVAIVVLLAIRSNTPVAPVVRVDRSDPSAVVESTAGVVTQIKGSRENFKIEYQRQLTYAGGASKLLGVKVGVDRRAGRNFVVTAREAEIGANQSSVVLTGDVRLTASDGLTAATEKATYDDGEGIVRAPGQVTFARGTLSGSGVGMTYDKNRDTLSLLDKAVVKVAAGADGAGSMDIEAGAAALARADKYIRFGRGVRMVREGRTAEADNATAYLSDDESRVTSLELRGNSRITGGAGGAGSLEAMTATDMNLGFTPDGRQLQTATLSGKGAIQMAGAPGGGGSRVAAQMIAIGLAPDGATLTSLNAREQVLVAFPAERGAPARTVRSTMLESTGDPAKGLTAARFSENVEYGEKLPGPPPAERIVRAGVLDAAVKAGLSGIDEARFSSGVRLEEGQLRAGAAAARYQVSQGIVELSGSQGNARPSVTDEQIAVEAGRIELTLDGRKLNATTDVRSQLRPARKPVAAAPARAKTVRMPGMLKQEEPVNVTAHTLAYEQPHALYTGSARLWQGETTVLGDTITLDEEKGDLTATGSVRTTWTVEQKNGETKAVEKVPTIATAKNLQYEDALHRATYTTAAHMNGPQGDLTAQKIELFLAGESSELDKVEAYEQVTVRVDKRTAIGARLTYFSTDARYVMEGEPVRIVEECRETTGKTLTFFKSADRIVVDGNEERRTQTKSGGKCPEPPFD